MQPLSARTTSLRLLSSALTPTSDFSSQFLRYALVGGTAFVVDAGLLSLLTAALRTHYAPASACGFLLGLLVNYALSLQFVFDRRKYDNRSLELLIFAVVGLAGLSLTELVMWTCIDCIGLPVLLAKAVAAAVVLVWNFTARKMLLF